jgi:hypothetical protein
MNALLLLPLGGLLQSLEPSISATTGVVDTLKERGRFLLENAPEPRTVQAARRLGQLAPLLPNITAHMFKAIAASAPAPKLPSLSEIPGIIYEGRIMETVRAMPVPDDAVARAPPRR